MGSVHHRETDPRSGLTLIVESDDDPVNPRTDYDHAGQMVCFHRRYRLGDAHDWRDPAAFQAHLKAHKGAVILDLFLYDHSGLAMRTTPFACPWDSGQVGVIWMSRETALRECGGPGARRLTSAIRRKAEDLLRAEVAEYDQYLRGDVWGVRVIDEDGDEQDSIWGLYGQNNALEQGKDMLAALAPWMIEQKAEAWASRVAADRPDMALAGESRA